MKDELLRVFIAGSVDDGKSTLLGRLLYDSKLLYDDTVETLKKQSGDNMNLALLTDGLKAEMEQGITIDVAYRYFSTPKRSFIVADTPGHVQYTRNMLTGASTAKAGIILIDIVNGITEQTLRHIKIAEILDVRSILFCVNKMDLVDWDYDKVTEITNQLNQIVNKRTYFAVLPTSAKNGDNVVEAREPGGLTVLGWLEDVQPVENNSKYFAMPVQCSLNNGTREYAGRICSGSLRVGDTVRVLPSGLVTKVKTIHHGAKTLSGAGKDESVSLELVEEIDVQRGDVITNLYSNLGMVDNLKMLVCSFYDNTLEVGRKYKLQHNGMEVTCIVTKIGEEDLVTKKKIGDRMQMNQITEVQVACNKQIVCDKYENNKVLGSFIFINNNKTIAAGVI